MESRTQRSHRSRKSDITRGAELFYRFAWWAVLRENQGVFREGPAVFHGPHPLHRTCAGGAILTCLTPPADAGALRDMSGQYSYASSYSPTHGYRRDTPPQHRAWYTPMLKRPSLQSPCVGLDSYRFGLEINPAEEEMPMLTLIFHLMVVSRRLEPLLLARPRRNFKIPSEKGHWVGAVSLERQGKS